MKKKKAKQKKKQKEKERKNQATESAFHSKGGVQAAQSSRHARFAGHLALLEPSPMDEFLANHSHL